MSSPNPASEIRALTGIRAIAALMVVLYHFHDTFVALIPAWRIFAPTAKVGLLGVDVFFILSGFILCLVYQAEARPVTWQSHRRFLALRLARIYPNHVVMLAGMGLLVALSTRAGDTIPGLFPLSQLPFQLTMTHAWFRSPGMEWNYPSWSISSEWFAYLFLFPLGAWCLKRRWHPAVYFVMTIAATQGWLHLMNTTWHRELFPMFRIICGFMAGVALYGVYCWAPGLVALCRRFTTVLLLGFLLATMVLPALWSHSPELMALLIPALLLGLTHDGTLAARLLGSEPAVWLGRWSYALYLGHAVVGSALAWWLPAERFVTAEWPVRVGLVALHGVAILGVAVALYHGVEQPARTWLRDRGRS